MTAIPDKYLDLLERKKAFAALATTMPDGSPQVTPVWFDYKDGIVRVNTAKGRVKARNLKAGAAVALAVIDPDNPYRYIQIRGRVRRCSEEGAGTHIELAREEISRQGQVSQCCTRRSAHNVRNRARSRLRNGVSILRTCCTHSVVMAGLVPAIHVFPCWQAV